MTDVITLIQNDHREVETLFGQYHAATDAEEKGRLIAKVTESLAQHAAAEEILVYPAVRRAAEDGREEASHAIDEHQEIKRALAEVDKLDVNDPGREAKVRELEQVVSHHVEEEETSVLPTLASGTDPSRLDSMGELFERMKPLLPTRPHPSVPGTATAQLLAGPLASIADRIRDFIERR